jgi:hypothetical protein
MIIQLNGVTLNDGLSGFYIDEPLAGLSLPNIRTSSGIYSGRDGGYVGAQFYDNRHITITGRAIATSTTLLETQRTTLQTAIRSKSVTVTLTTNAGRSYIIYANLLAFDMPIMRDNFRANFKIELLATDPVIYDNTGGTGQSATVQRFNAGGMNWPLHWPLNWGTGVGPTTVTNGGNTVVYPTVSLTGIMTNPIITNNTTGQVFKLTGLTTAAGDVVLIDLRAHTVTLNGGNIYNKVDLTSTWWGLAVGSNSIQLNTSSSSDTVVATVKWMSGYIGV